ncbi:RNA 2',3'-cyclic phosphodiesterase [Bacillaceae bacterium Marseille-Q3522]|nr:RNA 2',3'-cyclic phosphodiesterase [Bacillaceae bacterium Marseille-Q3522]
MKRESHYFLAVSLPNDVKRKLAAICGKLRSALPFQKWVHEQDYHITLAFLGTASDQSLQQLQTAISAFVRHESFSLEIHHFGTFGLKDKPRIFWAGVAKEQRLFDLQAQIQALCVKAGFLLEDRPYRPHITLARKWEGIFLFQRDWQQEISLSLPFTVKNITLYETKIDSTPKYKPVAIFPLID